MSLGSCSHLPIPNPNPFVAGQLLETHRATRADFIGADPNFGPHAELAAISESGRGIPIDGGGIDFAEELFGAGFVASHDAVGVGGAIMVNVVDRLPDALDDAQIQNVIVVFGVKILVGGGYEPELRVES